MTKKEFMLELQRTLNGRIGSKEAEPYVSYYQEYIEIEVRKGKTEEEVTGELGSPRLIAKSVADAFERESRKMPLGKALARYGGRMLLYGELFGKKGMGICREAARKAKEWFDRL